VCAGAEQLSRNERELSHPIEGRPARSRYTIETGVGKHLTRIRVDTDQGRRHQVRIHCSEGWRAPILLDPLYGGQSILSTLLKNTNTSNNGSDDKNRRRHHRSGLLKRERTAQRFCLHASTLRIDALGIDAKAPLPEWWNELEEELR
jgi:23S rRNA-/tRNA-specific pseudouridylate synthase